MNRLIILLNSIIFFGLVSCGSDSNLNQMVKAVETTDSCKLDPKNTYEVYVPAKNSANEKFPLLVIIDAHGGGQFALDKFKHAANQYPVVLVASNLVKNGFMNYKGAIQTLIEDVRQKYPVNKMIFMTGFSGGARMALGYALNHQVNGLMLCGALANADQVIAVHCPVIAISGMDDFNFIETAQYMFQENLIPQNLKIELTNASHNWQDSLTLADAFGFLCLSSPSKDIPGKTKSQLTMYSQNQKARIDSLKKQGDLLKAVQVARNMSSTVPFKSDKSFVNLYHDLRVSSGYINQLNKLNKSLKFEINARQQYMNSFTTKDSLWWKNEINTIGEEIKTEQDSYTNNMYRRIKGFLGIVCYSFGNQMVKEKNQEALNKIISIYRMLEPENSYVLYFSAFPYFWKGNNEAAISILKKARETGFSDMNRLKKDFPQAINSKIQ